MMMVCNCVKLVISLCYVAFNDIAYGAAPTKLRCLESQLVVQVSNDSRMASQFGTLTCDIRVLD